MTCYAQLYLLCLQRLPMHTRNTSKTKKVRKLFMYNKTYAEHLTIIYKVINNIELYISWVMGLFVCNTIIKWMRMYRDCKKVCQYKVCLYCLRLWIHKVGCHKKHPRQTTNKSNANKKVVSALESWRMIMEFLRFHLLQATSIHVVSWEI